MFNLGLFVKKCLLEEFSIIFLKFLHTFACIRFSNRIPDYVLATQHCTESQCIGVSFLRHRNSCGFFASSSIAFHEVGCDSHIIAYFKKYFQGDSVASLSFLASHFWMIEERVEWKQCKDGISSFHAIK